MIPPDATKVSLDRTIDHDLILSIRIKAGEGAEEAAAVLTNRGRLSGSISEFGAALVAWPSGVILKSEVFASYLKDLVCRAMHGEVPDWDKIQRALDAMVLEHAHAVRSAWEAEAKKPSAKFTGPATAVPIGQLAVHMAECELCRTTGITFATWAICTATCSGRYLREAEALLCPKARELVRAQRLAWAQLDAKDASRDRKG